MKGAPTVPPGRARPSGRQRAARAGLLLGLLALLVGLPGAAEATRVGPAAVCPPAATAGAEVAPAAPQPATSLPQQAPLDASIKRLVPTGGRCGLAPGAPTGPAAEG